MEIGRRISELRNKIKLTQAQLSEIIGVSQQAVQKWESGSALPDLDKLVLIAKYFNISLDTLVLGHDSRMIEEMQAARIVKPQYGSIPDTEFYASNLEVEYRQSIEEGLHIENYRDVFSAVARLPKGAYKKKLGDILFEVVAAAETEDAYPYIEPSDPDGIKALRKEDDAPAIRPATVSEDQIRGAWMGRICGCLLGKTVEGIRTDELIPFLKETDNFPMHRYICRTDITNETIDKYNFSFANRCYADEIDGMPTDDDTNYVVLAQELIRTHGRDFSPKDVAEIWLRCQTKGAYWTAERVAYCNFIKGFAPPASAVYKNPFREWIGAQIRGDYFGYINPGDPATAAEMAWRDASVSHIKNGIYGEMFVAAMLAVAACTNDMEAIIRGGLAQIPHTSRLYEAVLSIVTAFRQGTSERACFHMIHERYDERNGHDWCHTISNAMIVTTALLYGKGDFGRSICMAVEAGFDTDCNGATVGSVLGMAKGISSIPSCWTDPIHDTLHTSLFDLDTVKISDRVRLTLAHIAMK